MQRVPGLAGVLEDQERMETFLTREVSGLCKMDMIFCMVMIIFLTALGTVFGCT